MDVVALCDTNLVAIDVLLEGLNLTGLDVKRYLDYQKMLDCESLDMVAIATDSGSLAGIAVLVEKPMALSLADADEMLALSKKHNVLFGACQQNRFNDASLLVRKALDTGGFGKLSHVSAQVRWWRDADYYAQDGGPGRRMSASVLSSSQVELSEVLKVPQTCTRRTWKSASPSSGRKVLSY